VKLAGNLNTAGITYSLLVLLQVSISFCEEKMPKCSVPDCNKRSKKDRVRGITFQNLPVKKTRLAKQWLDQLRHDESFGFLKPENVHICTKQTIDLSKRPKSLHVLRLQEIPAKCTAKRKIIVDTERTG